MPIQGSPAVAFTWLAAGLVALVSQEMIAETSRPS